MQDNQKDRDIGVNYKLLDEVQRTWSDKSHGPKMGEVDLKYNSKDYTIFSSRIFILTFGHHELKVIVSRTRLTLYICHLHLFNDLETIIQVLQMRN